VPKIKINSNRSPVGSSHIAVLGMKKFQCLILCMLILIDDASDAMSNSNLLKTKSCFTEQKATAMLKRRRKCPKNETCLQISGKVSDSRDLGLHQSPCREIGSRN
jgi:hypothetical protein